MLPNHPEPGRSITRTASVPGVEIFEPYILMDLAGNASKMTFDQAVPGSIPGRFTKCLNHFERLSIRTLVIGASRSAYSAPATGAFSAVVCRLASQQPSGPFHSSRASSRMK